MFRVNRKSSLFMLLVLITTLVLTGCSGSAQASSNKPVDVQVTLTEFTITSSVTTFKVGVPYHFTVNNAGTAAHELEIMPPESGTLTADQISKLALASLSQSDLPAGATKTLDYTFTKAYPQGTIEFACHLAGHYEAGMHLPIVVNP